MEKIIQTRLAVITALYGPEKKLHEIRLLKHIRCTFKVKFNIRGVSLKVFFRPIK